MTAQRMKQENINQWLNACDYSAYLLNYKKSVPLLSSFQVREALEYLSSQSELDVSQFLTTLSQLVQINECTLKPQLLGSTRYLSQVSFLIKDEAVLPLEKFKPDSSVSGDFADTRLYYLSTPIPERKLSKVQFVSSLMNQRWPLIGLMLLIGSPALLLAALSELLQQPLFDSFVPEAQIPSIILVGIASLGLQLSGQCFSTIQTLIQDYFNQNIELETKVATARRFLRARASSLPTRDVGSWRLTFSVASAFLGSIDALLISIPLAIISMIVNLLVVGAFTDFTSIFSLFKILLIPTAISLCITYFGSIISIRVMSQESSIDTIIYSVVKQIRAIWLSNTEQVYSQRFARARDAMSRNLLQSGVLDSSSLLISTIFQGILYAFIFNQYYQTYTDPVRADLSVGSILVIYFAIGSLSASLNSIAQDLVSVAQTLPTYWTPNAIRDINEFDHNVSSDKSECPVTVEISNLTFFFPDGSSPFESPVSLELNADKSYAIVGPSGSGKSTFLNLLIGHLTPKSGSIRLLDQFQQQYGDSLGTCDMLVLTQDPTLYGSRLIDVVDPSRKYTIDVIESACAKLDLIPLLDSLPLRWQTPVNEFSRDLSLGQLQRFKIARALIDIHDIIISDEATCHLPEQQHLEALQLLNAQSRIHLSVLHRLSALKLFDYVIELDHAGNIKLIPASEFRL